MFCELNILRIVLFRLRILGRRMPLTQCYFAAVLAATISCNGAAAASEVGEATGISTSPAGKHLPYIVAALYVKWYFV